MRNHKTRWIWLLLLVLLGIGALGGSAWLFGDLPDPASLSQRLNAPSIRITDRHGRLLYEILPATGGRHTVLPLEAIPLSLRQATIATEDANFYQHPGVDLTGILRAFWINLRGGETLAGGSTLTQQVARNLLLEETERFQQRLARKLRESYLAWQLTRRYSKDEILALYLNQTYYGGLAYGVEAAAQTFFGKPASQLDLAEAALIAGLPQAPAPYNPFTDLEAAQARQAVVLRLMVQAGYLSQAEQSQAENEPLVFNPQPYPLEAPHFVWIVRAQLDGLFSSEEVYQSGGLTVRTSLDLDWQRLAETAIQRQLAELANTPDGLGHNVNNAALVALDPTSGEILALIGNPDFTDAAHSGAINMATALRQPGSALKPILYAAVLSPDQAQPWTAATGILDVRTSFVTHDNQAYTPSNYDLIEHGPVLLREALGSSLNIPAVITLDHLGLPAFFEFAARLGLDSFGNPENYDLSLALGGGAVRLLDLTAAYGAFANNGYQVRPVSLLEVVDSQGILLYQAPAPERVRVMDERVAWLISDILNDNQARTLGFGQNSILRLERSAAVKTGTTSNFHDNWTLGYTPSLVVGVWAGNADYQPMRNVSGVSGAAPIWHQFMRAALSGVPDQPFPRPEGLVQVEVCRLSGLLPTPDCPYRRQEWFLNGTQPSQQDSYYHQVVLDLASGRLADENTPPERQVTRLALDLPLQAQPWARQQGLLLLSDLLPREAGPPGAGVPEAGSLLLPRIISPPASSIYQITEDFPAEAQRLLIEAVAPSGLGMVTLWLDGVQIAAFESPPYQAWWTLQPGEHQLWAEGIATDGSQVAGPEVLFTVK